MDHITSYGYDALGNRTSVVDPMGVEARNVYDDLGRLSAVVENYVSGGPDDSQTNVRSQYTYDAVGNLISVRDALGSVPLAPCHIILAGSSKKLSSSN